MLPQCGDMIVYDTTGMLLVLYKYDRAEYDPWKEYKHLVTFKCLHIRSGQVWTVMVPTDEKLHREYAITRILRLSDAI